MKALGVGGIGAGHVAECAATLIGERADGRRIERDHRDGVSVRVRVVDEYGKDDGGGVGREEDRVVGRLWWSVGVGDGEGEGVGRR